MTMTTESMPAVLALSEGLGAGAEARCMCKDRALSACPGEWEPGCDLGNNPAHVRVANRAACEVDRDWLKCWRGACYDAKQCVAPNVL